MLTVTGDLDLATAPRVAVRIRELCRGGACDVVLDLAGVTFVDSAGLAVLVNARRALARVDGRLVVVAPPDGRVARVLDLCGVRGVLEVVGSRAGA